VPEGGEGEGLPPDLIATDGVFSMDGSVAELKSICDLADRYQALVMVDDCHATGFLGRDRARQPRARRRDGRVDIITGTLGKALGGALGGFTTGGAGDHRAAAPALAVPTCSRTRCRRRWWARAIAVFDLLSRNHGAARQLEANTKHFRAA
jgi:glycine C-acetyltransferase